MSIRWLTLFLDVPADRADAGTAFWCAATGSALSPWRQDRFATVVPPDGDAYLRVQRTDDGSPGRHLDVHVDDPGNSVPDAVGLGAGVVGEFGSHTVLRSPGGLTFCLVPWSGEQRVPSPVGPPGTETRADQVCLDIPGDAFDAEATFWERLTSWPVAASRVAEFARLEVPATLPLHVLLQRRATWAPGDPVAAHLDVACRDRASAVAAHVALGAEATGEGPRWTVLRDPAGAVFCLTDRDPATGRLPG